MKTSNLFCMPVVAPTETNQELVDRHHQLCFNFLSLSFCISTVFFMLYIRHVVLVCTTVAAVKIACGPARASYIHPSSFSILSATNTVHAEITTCLRDSTQSSLPDVFRFYIRFDSSCCSSQCVVKHKSPDTVPQVYSDSHRAEQTCLI